MDISVKPGGTDNGLSRALVAVTVWLPLTGPT